MLFTRNDIMSYLSDHIVESYVTEMENPTYESAVFDSREAVKDIIFIAIDGEKSAGIFYVVDAIERGATCVVANVSYRDELSETIKKYSQTIDFVLVDDSMIVFGLLGKLAREQFSGDVIGVIGSVGKTTTKNMLRELGGGQLLSHASRGSYNNQTGGPLTLCAIPVSAKRAIVELGESHFGDLTYITEFTQPNIVVITNVAEAHTEFLGDLAGVAQTMNETVSLVAESGTIVVPYDITHRDIVLENAAASVIYIICENGAPEDVVENNRCATITDVQAREDLTHDFVLNFDGHTIELHVPLIGRHFVMDAALAAVAILVSGEDADVLNERLENVAAQGRRMSVITTDKLVVIDDCYNANPSSMKASMKAVADMARVNNYRSVFVMGPMRELGANSDEYHRELGRYANESGIDVLICVGELTQPASIEGIHCESYYFTSVQEACEKIFSLVKEGDIVGVKASRGPNPEVPVLAPLVEILSELK